MSVMTCIPFILKDNVKLYHSTTTDYEILKNQYLWTSIDINQSMYHPFDGLCGRYIKYYKSNNYLWPRLYELCLKKYLKLLNLKFINNEHYIKINDDHNYDYPDSDISNYIKLSEWIEINSLVNYNINPKNPKDPKSIQKSIQKFIECNDRYSFDCNFKILNLIINNKILNDEGYDGYICMTDQREIAIINPVDKLIINNLKYLTSISNINLFNDYHSNTTTTNINNIKIFNGNFLEYKYYLYSVIDIIIKKYITYDIHYNCIDEDFIKSYILNIDVIYVTLNIEIDVLNFFNNVFINYILYPGIYKNCNYLIYPYNNEGDIYISKIINNIQNIQSIQKNNHTHTHTHMHNNINDINFDSILNIRENYYNLDLNNLYTFINDDSSIDHDIKYKILTNLFIKYICPKNIVRYNNYIMELVNPSIIISYT